MKYFSQLSLLLPFAFFCAAAALYLAGDRTVALTWVGLRHEVFVITAVILSLPLIYRQKWASDRNVLRGIRHLFFLIVMTGGILFLSRQRFSLLQQKIISQDWFRLNWSDSVFVVLWAFFSLIFILIALGTLRNLIYVKRRRNTARHFAWLMVLMLLYAFLGLYKSRTQTEFVENEFLKYFDNIVLFLLINFIVINSFRVGWINYLNKKQKLACFFGGFLLIPLQISFVNQFKEVSPVYNFSPFLERFVEMGMIFIAVYLSFAFLALLAHLPTARLYDRKLQQIRSLHDLSRVLSSEFDWDRLVQTIVRLAAQVTEAQYSWLELYVNGRLALASSWNLSLNEERRRQADEQDRLYEALRSERESLLLNEAGKDPLLRTLRRWKSGLGSLVAAPLITSDQVLGYLFAAKQEEFSFEQDDAEMMRAFADQAAAAIMNAKLVEQSLVKERLEQELRIAHEAQMKLLPKTMPVLNGMAFDAVCITANEVGGDYYDFFDIGEELTAVVVGDVSGKGPSAAFYMAEVKGIMEALAAERLSPEEMLAIVNETVYRNFDRNTFISLIYGLVDARRRRFTFCRAGHCPVYHYRAAEAAVRRLEPRGIGLGLTSSPLFQNTLETMIVDILPQDCFLLFTDGVIEARNPAGEEFGEERLAEAFQEANETHANEIKKHLLHRIYAFFDGAAAFDDLTFVLFKAVAETES
ncbi:MAG: SpoIIE family protein phosphatase [candidate division KSB1 bacterium]|nr:SpoIIE family protein phosphatase [candidate division KSB1 bacterium]